jgi:hypothetical protein
VTVGYGIDQETRTAVVPPPLCRDCRWCRPAWPYLVNPLLWFVPLIWRELWSAAKCRHPTSRFRPTRDFVTGRREQPRSMSCNTARSYSAGEYCGNQARYWEARGYPAWLWTAGPIGMGIALLLGYVAFLHFF